MNLNDELVKAATAKAVLEMVTPESRDAMIADAIKALLTPVKSPYGSREATSPLQDAFNSAVRSFAEKTIEKHVMEDPTFHSAVKQTVLAAIERAFTGENAETMIQNMAKAVLAAFEPKRDF